MNQKKEKLFSGIFIAMMLSSTLVSLCNYLFHSTMPMYVKSIGASQQLIGLASGVYTFACFATRTFAGTLCDRYGRFVVMITGIVLCIAGCFGYAFSYTILMLVVMRTLHGIGFGSHTTAGGTVVVDVIPKSRRMEGLGYYSLYSTICSAIGPGIALAIIENEKLGFRALFLLAGTIMTITMVVDLCCRKPIQDMRKAAAEKPQPVATARSFLGFELRAVPPALIMVVLTFAQSSVISYLAVYCAERNLSNIGLFFTISSAAIFCSRFFVGKIGDRLGIGKALIPCILMASVSLFAISMSSSRIALFLIAVPYGLGFGAAGPIIHTIVVNVCDDAHRSSATSLYFASLDVGLGVGAIVLGVVSAALGYQRMIFVSGFIALIALPIYFLFVSRQLKAGGKSHAS